MGEHMFEVTKCEPPQIFVTCRRTGETWVFSAEVELAIMRDGSRSDQEDAHRAAIVYLAQTARAA